MTKRLPHIAHGGTPPLLKTYATRYLFELDNGATANKTKLLESYSEMMDNYTHELRMAELYNSLTKSVRLDEWASVSWDFFSEKKMIVEVSVFTHV